MAFVVERVKERLTGGIPCARPELMISVEARNQGRDSCQEPGPESVRLALDWVTGLCVMEVGLSIGEK